MKSEKLILNIVTKIEEKYGCLSWGYRDFHTDGSFRFWCICLDDFEIYMHDKSLKVLIKAWSKISKHKIIFYYQSANEKIFEQLLIQDNLIMNI